jgi:hypothetical protein
LIDDGMMRHATLTFSCDEGVLLLDTEALVWNLNLQHLCCL